MRVGVSDTSQQRNERQHQQPTSSHRRTLLRGRVRLSVSSVMCVVEGKTSNLASRLLIFQQDWLRQSASQSMEHMSCAACEVCLCG